MAGCWFTLLRSALSELTSGLPFFTPLYASPWRAKLFSNGAKKRTAMICLPHVTASAGACIGAERKSCGLITEIPALLGTVSLAIEGSRKGTSLYTPPSVWSVDHVPRPCVECRFCVVVFQYCGICVNFRLLPEHWPFPFDKSVWPSVCPQKGLLCPFGMCVVVGRVCIASNVRGHFGR